MKKRNQVRVGLVQILEDPQKYLKGKRIGIICNQASVNNQFLHIADLFYQNDNINLVSLFGPQHGIRGDVQDNMVETGHNTDVRDGFACFFTLQRNERTDTTNAGESRCSCFRSAGCRMPRLHIYIYDGECDESLRKIRQEIYRARQTKSDRRRCRRKEIFYKPDTNLLSVNFRFRCATV